MKYECHACGRRLCEIHVSSDEFSPDFVEKHARCPFPFNGRGEYREEIINDIKHFTEESNNETH